MHTRVQPITVIAVALVSGLTESWWVLALFGAIMLVGAWKPRLNLLDVFVSAVSGRVQRTTLYPKRFATGMGGAMLLAAGALGASGLAGAALVLIAMTLVAASLQAFFQVCVGCWIFSGIVAPFMTRGNRPV